MGFSLFSIFDNFSSFVGKSYQRFESLADSDRSRQGRWLFVYLVCFGIILFLNVLTPMIADDFSYLYIFGEKEQVSNLSELIRSQVTHYEKWGGRSVVHFIAQGLLQMPRYLVDVLNSLVYLLFVSLIYLHVRGKRGENRISIFILINLAIWFITPKFGDTILWVTGSANYLWGTTIILLFLLPYRFYEGQKRSLLQKVIFSALMLLCGIIAGWTNENTVAGMIAIIILFLLSYRSGKWSIPVELVAGLIGAVIGYIIMIAAPGNIVRAGGSVDVSLFLILYRVLTYTQTLFLDYGVLIVIYICSILLYRQFTSKDKSDIYLSFIYILGAIASIYAMIFSPQFPARAWFGLLVYVFIGIGIIVSRLSYQEQFIKRMRDAVLFIGCIAFLFSFYLATKDIHRIYEIDKEREVLAKEARERGDEKCYFKMFIPQTEYVHGEEWETNLQLSYYYGIFIEYEGK